MPGIFELLDGVLIGRDDHWRTKMVGKLKLLYGIFITKAIFMITGFSLALYLLMDYEATRHVNDPALCRYLGCFMVFGFLGMCLGISAVVMNKETKRKPLMYIAVLMIFHMVGEFALAVSAAKSQLANHNIISGWSIFLYLVFGTIAGTSLITILMVTFTLVQVYQLPETRSKTEDALRFCTSRFSIAVLVRFSFAILKSVLIAAFLAQSHLSPSILTSAYIVYYCLGVISASLSILGIINTILGGLGTFIYFSFSLLLLLVVEVGCGIVFWSHFTTRLIAVLPMFTVIDLVTHFKCYYLELSHDKKRTTENPAWEKVGIHEQ